MSRNKPSKTSPPKVPPARKARAQRSKALRRQERSLERRFKAAGLDGPHGEDVHEIRRRLMRRVSMIVNRWRGCREPLCRRQRGCMAPQGNCTNIASEPPADERRLGAFKATLRKALQARLAAAATGSGHRSAHGRWHKPRMTV
jgi:hypothetical protein